MASKPQNHVTRSLEEFFSGPDVTPQLPLLDRTQLEQLEALYPPRCLDRSETAEDHLRYAGAVELVQRLRVRFEDKQGVEAEEADPMQAGEDAHTA